MWYLVDDCMESFVGHSQDVFLHYCLLLRSRIIIRS